MTIPFHIQFANEGEPLTEAAGWPNDGHIRLPRLPAQATEAAHASSLRDAIHQLWQNARSATDLLELCRSLVMVRDLEAAAEVLEAAKHRGLDADVARATKATLSWLAGDWSELRRLSEQVIASSAQPLAVDFLALATACRNLEDAEGAAKAAACALALDRAQLEAAFIASWAASERGDGAGMLACYRELARLEPGNTRWMIEVVRVLQHLGRVKEAAAAMDSALDRAPDSELLWNWALGYGYRTQDQALRAGVPDDIVAGFRAHLRYAPTEDELLRPLMVDVFGCDVIVAPAGRSDTLALVFTGASNSLSMPLPVFDRFLAARGVTAIYLKDFRRLMYLNGIASFGDDFQTSIHALRQLQRRLGVSRLCTIGDSAGGFAAIRYGVELDAACALSFGGDTHWAPGHGEFALFANHLRSHFAVEAMDLRPLLATRKGCARISLVYGENEKRDKLHADHLSDLERVEPCPVAGRSDHNILRWLAMNHGLAEILDRTLGSGTRNGL
jgi:tetratricopeptide (TPR) repeat protein